MEQLFVATAGWVNARAGGRGRARELLAQLEAMPRPGAYYRAMVHAGLGETDRALALLETAADHRDSMFPQVGSLPVFEPLHALPRFGVVLRRVGLSR
ncbi:MAG TPA: hypothetical protein VMM83_03175 [Longimicrobiales bacterium]|nr:hypothetical protein [Longimicrobiales bacterium]